MKRFWTSAPGIVTMAASPVALVILIALFPRPVGIPVLIIGGFGLYCLPSIITGIRSSANVVGIVLVNILLGWTAVGWVGALVWSLIDKTEQQKVAEQQRQAAMHAWYMQQAQQPQQPPQQ